MDLAFLEKDRYTRAAADPLKQRGLETGLTEAFPTQQLTCGRETRDPDPVLIDLRYALAPDGTGRTNA
ncbi:MAG: hypothetical protein EPO54_08085 [Brevundimonas sp.]|nr:MAG: hypothetical protein EPO54_08085 [Brevundimonas sp.]